MTSFFITTTARDTPWNPYSHANYLRVIKAAEIGDKNKYEIADHPKDADIVIFVEPQRKYQSDIRREPMYREYREKVMVLDFFDNPEPQIPGLYVGLGAKESSSDLYQAGYYIRVADNEMIDPSRMKGVQQDLLYSFIGKVSNSPIVRDGIMSLKHPRGFALNQSSNQSDNDINYVNTIFRSKFVLAPRGIGPASWRLFETLKAGRVPVIISDEWAPPQGVRWTDISVRVSESNIKQIPEILESLESRSLEMGRMAREEWIRLFSKEGSFGWIAERLSDIHSKYMTGSKGEKKINHYLYHSSIREKREILKEIISVRLK